MKRLLKYLLLLPLIAGAFTVSKVSSKKVVENVSAESVRPYATSGGNTSIIFVSGGVFGKSAPAVIYVWNNSGGAWSNKVDYTVDGAYPVVLPPTNGSSWSKFLIARYNPDLEPSVNEGSGIYNQTDDLSMSIFSARGHNCISVTGYDGTKLTVNTESLSYKNFYGIKGDTHFYLDLKNCSWWENDDAKFAIYFAHSNYFGRKEDWSLSNSNDGYYLAFMWKVHGQDKGQENDHLYECIVPGGAETLWNLAIAVRFKPEQGYPGWYNYWNQTDDINFNSSNHTANMIEINSDGVGSIDPSHAISKITRLNFYGQYFLDTVSCSGDGNSDSTTSEQWAAVKAEYKNHLSSDFQYTIWTTTADESGSTIAQAMARYDYILFYKQYTSHEDFINRVASQNKTVYTSETYIGLQPYISDKNVSIYIIVIALTSITTLGILIVVKRKKVQK